MIMTMVVGNNNIHCEMICTAPGTLKQLTVNGCLVVPKQLSAVPSVIAKNDKKIKFLLAEDLIRACCDEHGVL